MAKHTITNRTEAPQGFYQKGLETDFAGEITYVLPGQSLTVELEGPTLQAAKEAAKHSDGKIIVTAGAKAPPPVEAEDELEDLGEGVHEGLADDPSLVTTDPAPAPAPAANTVKPQAAEDTDPRTDAEIKAELERRTGKAVHPQSKRANWLKKLAALPAEAAPADQPIL